MWFWIEKTAHWIGLLLGIVAIAAVCIIVTRPSTTTGNQPNFAGAELQKKRLAVFLDGTWNSVDSNTNVWRMRALCASKSADGRPQLIYYSVGVNGFLGACLARGSMKTSGWLMSGWLRTTPTATKSTSSASAEAPIPRELWLG